MEKGYIFFVGFEGIFIDQSMAAGAEVTGEAAELAVVQAIPTPEDANGNRENDNSIESNPKSELKMSHIVDMLSNLKLNPMAKEFFPSKSNDQTKDLLLVPNFAPPNEHFGYDGWFDNQRRRSNSNQGRRRFNGRTSRAHREDSIRRTVYVSEIDQSVTEERLAALFSSCGQVVDCRICGDPHSRLRFAFVEFADDRSAREAINFSGTIIGFYPIKVLPSKTAILPVNPTFLPQSEDEREMCARTVYCTNIDKQITQAEVKFFFESCCGEVSRLRLLGDNTHSTRIAFVEFTMAESAIAALHCSGRPLGAQPIRVSPSKTPVRPRVPRHPQN